MLAGSTDLDLLIPQKPPMVMVDGLLAHTETESVSCFEIKPDNIFLSNGALRFPGLIENIAQTCALRSGFAFSEEAKKAQGPPAQPPVGFIGEVKNAVIHRLPKVGEVLHTKIDLLHTVFTASIVKGEVSVNGEVIASCEMKIFVAPQ
ncbi:MAG: 3-hydroxyacyl-ACP dehydratase [Chitinophagales bacterium]